MTMYKWTLKTNHFRTHTESREEELKAVVDHIKQTLFFIALQPSEDILKYYVRAEDVDFYGDIYDPDTETWRKKTREEELGAPLTEYEMTHILENMEDWKNPRNYNSM